MSDFAAILADTYTITKLPQLEDLTKMAVKHATMRLHCRNYYPKDFLDIGLEFSSSAYIQALEYKTVIPRYRQLSYVRKASTDGTDITLGNFFTVLTPDQTLDRYAVNRENVVYQAGFTLNMRSSEVFQNVILGCWLFPDTAELSYTSWIADEFPTLVALEAAKMVANTKGDKNLVSFLTLELQDYYPILDSQIVAVVN